MNIQEFLYGLKNFIQTEFNNDLHGYLFHHELLVRKPFDAMWGIDIKFSAITTPLNPPTYVLEIRKQESDTIEMRIDFNENGRIFQILTND